LIHTTSESAPREATWGADKLDPADPEYLPKCYGRVRDKPTGICETPVIRLDERISLKSSTERLRDSDHCFNELSAARWSIVLTICIKPLG